MELSSEDTLKLNVLLANTDAIRINESTMCVHGLRGGSEARVQLNPTCKPDKYIKLVREALSTLVLGSPKGYPVYLRRWTRMGEMQTTRLEPLLKLGEEEALIAVARAPGLTDELARRIWWALPDPNVARYMLENPAVVNGNMGSVLAEFLAEFLPFEEHAYSVIQTVSLILQPGLITAEQKDQIWQRGARKNHFYVGFLHATPNDLPERPAAHPLYPEISRRIGSAVNNPVAQHFVLALDSPGQGFLNTCAKVMRKPSDQDVVVSLLEAIWNYFSPVRPDDRQFGDINDLATHVDALLNGGNSAGHDVPTLLSAVPEQRDRIGALLLLAYAGEPLVRPVFARTDSVGSVMRKRIDHLTAPLMEAITKLRS